MSQPETDDDWRARLRASGHRLTPQRELILAAVERLRHATPDEVLTEVRKQSSAINLSTIYRTLEVLERFGLVRHAHLSDRSPTYHAVTGHTHFHVKCRKCARVISVEEDKAASLADLLRREHRFVMDVGHLTVFGECEECPDEQPDD